MSIVTDEDVEKALDTFGMVKTGNAPEIAEDWHRHYVALRELPDGRVCGVARLIYHWTLHVDISEFGYIDRYCYATKEAAEHALASWDGVGDPVGWTRHPKSGRRRDLATGREWIAT